MTSSTTGAKGHAVEIWTRRTLADGSQMYSGCIKPICDAINESDEDVSGLSAAIDYVSGALVDEVNRATNADRALSEDITDEVNRAKNVEGELSAAISAETTARIDADQNLQKQIDTLEAATDVIAVFGTYPEFTAASAGTWQEQVTDNDFIKVLRDSAYNPTGDEDANTSDDDYYQVYYQWHSSAHDGWDGWSAIGNLDPYYSVAEIDEYKEEVSGKFTSLSATVANNYLSATAVKAGDNIIVTKTDGKPEITISTSADVVFTNISATAKITADTAIFTSGKINTGNILTAYGSSANFDDISGKNISANIISGTNIAGDKLTVNTSAKIVGISATNVSSTNISAKNISGLENITAKAGYFTDISATNNISAESATIVNVSSEVLSASNIHSNISSFFRDVKATNLTAEFGRIPNFSTDEITADSSISSKNITADYIEGTDALITNITGNSGYFTDLRGETLQGVNSSIAVDELISAVSSMSGESNLYVRKDELECKIGSANSATIRSFAQGKSNRANENSFVQGELNSANDDSFAQGYYNSAYRRSFAQGYYNTAYYESLAQGQTNIVSNYSIAQGNHNIASNTAQAFGYNLVIESAMAIGKFNKTSSDAVFVIGNGTADDARNDLMVVDNLANITLNREEDNDIYSVIINPNILSGSYSSNRGGTISTGNYQSDWISICRNASGDYVPKTANQCSIGEANNTAIGNYVLVQGESNFASTYSFAQGTDNTAKSNSITQGSANSATNNAQAFGEQAYASAGIAINPHLWGSTTPTMAINNSFAMGKECVASGNSFAFGYETTATVNSLAFGTLNSAANNSLAFGAGITVDSGHIGLGYFPKNNSNYIFYVGAGVGSGANQRRNVLTLTNGGALTINNNSGNGVFSINGNYLYSIEQNSINYFRQVSGYSINDTTQATANPLNIHTIQSQNLVLYGSDDRYLNMWLPDTIESKHFKILKAAAGDGLTSTYKMSIGVSSGYNIIMKNFNQNYKIITGVTENCSWSTDPKYTTAVKTSNVSIYDEASTTNTCYWFGAIPSVDNIDVIIDNNAKTFIMIKNHSDLYTYN